MADDVEDSAGGGGSSNKMLIIIIAVVVLLVGGGGAAFFLLSGDDASQAQLVDGDLDAELTDDLTNDEVSEISSDDDASVGDAFYVGMPRPFVFNVSGYGKSRLVEIKVQLLVRGGSNDTAARKHIPLIEDTLLTVFSGANAEKLSTHIGKQELRENALAAVRKTLEPIVGNPVVEKLLFIGFVMQ